ncbi:hypothetical protein CDD83_8769 [Cordyceps sp. RAO-2017]|nr:hypothetical protein CDD83_8769 [Cordyceps sp. RAO-2017]
MRQAESIKLTVVGTPPLFLLPCLFSPVQETAQPFLAWACCRGRGDGPEPSIDTRSRLARFQPGQQRRRPGRMAHVAPSLAGHEAAAHDRPLFLPLTPPISSHALCRAGRVGTNLLGGSCSPPPPPPAREARPSAQSRQGSPRRGGRAERGGGGGRETVDTGRKALPALSPPHGGKMPAVQEAAIERRRRPPEAGCHGDGQSSPRSFPEAVGQGSAIGRRPAGRTANGPSPPGGCDGAAGLRAR